MVKNKVAPPFTECEFDIMYNEGISSVGSLLDLAMEYDIIQKRGSWISYNGSQIAQGATPPRKPSNPIRNCTRKSKSRLKPKWTKRRPSNCRLYFSFNRAAPLCGESAFSILLQIPATLPETAFSGFPAGIQ